MGDIYVARQPIFDRKMKLFGYELLYRRSARNVFEGEDDDKATAALFTDTFFMGYDELVDGTRGFINFSEKLLLQGVPMLLPRDRLVVEVLERVAVTDEVVEACREIKRQGYTLALDDFVFSEEYAPLVEMADIIKIEFPRMPKADQTALLKRYRPRVSFLAEKVETVDEYRHAVRAGYGLFQGYFFSRPMMINAREIGILNNNMVLISQKLTAPDPDFKAVAAIIERDVELSYKLLRIANSAYYGMRAHITSIHHALVTLGVQELLRWGNLILLKGLNNTDNAELVKISLVRARMLSQFAVASRRARQESDYFLTGLFSSIDSLLHQSMEQVMSRLPLTDAVKGALLGEDNEMRRALNAVLCFERADWGCTDAFLSDMGLSTDTFMSLYYEALRWQHSLDV
jgi:EAL and modified HD-GYP domain-containing signal transduction protein